MVDVLLQTAANATNQATATANFVIGQDGGGITFWNGMIGECRMYDTNLAGSEIANIYSGVATPSANLRGWWTLDEGTGTAAADDSGYLNNGTLSGATLPQWVAGEAEITFTGGNQTGAVTISGLMRERLIVRSDLDRIKQMFLNAGDVRASFDVALLELIS